jgi:hypothetical protein
MSTSIKELEEKLQENLKKGLLETLIAHLSV